MIWNHFLLAAGISTSTWLLAAFIPKRALIRNILVLAGIAGIAIFIGFLWINLERPPLRTLGETRLWYAFFLPIIGFLTYWRWRYNWMLHYSLALSILFLFINYLHPENFSKILMPALQSPWFVPHVVVYICAYAFLAASSLVAIRGLYQEYKTELQPKIMLMADNLVYLGFAFLTLGLLFGVLWAKEAWGHYWTWDPKETWSLITWFIYASALHARFTRGWGGKRIAWIAIIGFLAVVFTYYGVNFLLSGLHSYGG